MTFNRLVLKIGCPSTYRHTTERRRFLSNEVAQPSVLRCVSDDDHLFQASKCCGRVWLMVYGRHVLYELKSLRCSSSLSSFIADRFRTAFVLPFPALRPPPLFTSPRPSN